MFSALGTLILLGFLVWLGRRVRAADAGLRALQAVPTEDDSTAPSPGSATRRAVATT